MSDAWDHPLDELAELVADIWATPEPASEDTRWSDHHAELRAEDREYEQAIQEEHRWDKKW